MALRRADYGLLVLILVLTAIKGTVWSIAIPLYQGPDENRHFATVQFIAEHRRLPGPGDIYRDDENLLAGELSDAARLWYAPEHRQAFADGLDGPREADIAAIDPALRTSMERQALNIANHLSPLFYVLGTFVYRLEYADSLIARVFAVRQLSVACAVGTVLCAFATARQVFPRRRAMWFTVPVLVSFQPMFTFITAVVNSDALHILLYTVLLYLSVRVASGEWNWATAAVAGAVLGLGMLTKPIILGALPVLLLAVAWQGWRSRRWWRALGGLSMAGVVLLVVCGWWLWRSVQLSGELLYANPVQMGMTPVEHPYYGYTLFSYSWHYLLSLMGGVFTTYWAYFGWIDTPLAPGIYWLLLAICVLATIGIVVHLVRAWRNHETRQYAATLSVLLCSTPLLVVMIGYNVYRTWVIDGIGWGGMQGRYYLGPVMAAMVGIVVGVLSLVPARWQLATHLVLRWGIVLLNLVGLFGALLPRYYL